jgi:hypothetical protein
VLPRPNKYKPVEKRSLSPTMALAWVISASAEKLSVAWRVLSSFAIGSSVHLFGAVMCGDPFKNRVLANNKSRENKANFPENKSEGRKTERKGLSRGEKFSRRMYPGIDQPGALPCS